MARQHLSHVRIAGISAAVPEEILENRDSGFFENDEAYHRFVANVGIERRRRMPPGLTCSDLCEGAAEALLAHLGWAREEIGLLVFVSQSQDYPLPATSCILQARMGLPQSTMCLDISSGCSGWVLGLATAGALMESGAARKALILAGDAGTRLPPQSPSSAPDFRDKSHGPLFGPSGTATAIEYQPGAPPIFFDHQNDGTGYEAIIKRYGGTRHPFCAEALEPRTDANGNTRRGIDTEMDGAAVYVFGITRVPGAVGAMLTNHDLGIDDIDWFLFHQANLMMNEKIRKKCGIPAEKCPYSLRDFGNNSSGSIPLTVVTELAGRLPATPQTVLACGFGVGLAWSTAILTLDRVAVVPLLEMGGARPSVTGEASS